MKTQKLVSLYISIFTERENWSSLLKNSIRPLITDLLSRKFAFSYLLSFNFFRGKNIRITIITDEKNRIRLSSEIDMYLKKALSECFVGNEPTGNGNCTFISFPQNSIQYGLFETDNNFNFSFILQHKLKLQLSQLLSQVFSEEEITDESVISFAFYLNMIALKFIITKYKAQEEVTEYFNDNFNVTFVNNTEDQKFVENKFAENRDLLSEIYQDIFLENTGQLTNEVTFIQTWNSFCHFEIENLSRYDVSLSKDKIYYMFIYHMNFIIAQHLGMENATQILYHYFITKTLPSNTD